MNGDPLWIRLFLDEDVHSDLAELIRQRGFDCQSAAEAMRLGFTDEQQLEYATAEGRSVLSFNVADFAVLAQHWACAGRSHAGIVVTPQVSRKAIGQLLRGVLQLLNTYTADEMRDVFRYL